MNNYETFNQTLSGVGVEPFPSSDEHNDPLQHRSPITISEHPLAPSAMGQSQNPTSLLMNEDHTPTNTNTNDIGSTSAYTDVSINSNDTGGSVHVNGGKSVERVGPYIRITVKDPKKEYEQSNSSVVSGKSYMTYLVSTKTNMVEFGREAAEGGNEGEVSLNVRRRFKDVVALADRLSKFYKGYVIPLRPDRNVVERQVMQKTEFVEQRRAALEKYLRRLAVHPVINKSGDFKAFLQEGKLPYGELKKVSVVIPNEAVKGGKDLMRVFRELKQSVTNDWGSTKFFAREDDKEFAERTEKLKDLEKQLSNVTEKAESFVKAQQDIGETMGELGLTFIKLAKFETEEATCSHQRLRVVEVKRAATAAIKVGRLYRASNAQTVKHLDTLHDYLGLMLAVQGAFSDRASALLALQSVLSELSSLHSKAQKLEGTSSKIFGGDKSRIQKVEELKETIRVTEDDKTRAVRDYERIKENNKSELERLDKERHEDFLNMLKGFATSQVLYAEKIADVWGKVADETAKFAK